MNMKVVRNLPVYEDIKPKKINFEGKKIILYQGAVI